jgi:GNAT superfamily N-acetyltransferase
MRNEVRNAAVPIRAAMGSECGELARLAGQLGYESSAEQIAQRLAGMARLSESAVFVAEKKPGEILGWISLFVFRPLTSDPRVEISGLIVDESHRSRQIGALLLQRADQWAIAMGCSVIGVHTNVTRERAHAFYERNGYTLLKTQKLFRKDVLSD